MLTVHHLSISQSERIVFLCEELGLEYKLVTYKRDPLMAPATLKSIPGNHLEAAPLIQDGDLTMIESGAITEYLIHKHANGKLALKPDHPNYTDYLYWFHLANAGLQPAIMMQLFMGMTGVPDDNNGKASSNMRLERMFKHYEERLGQADYLAGNDFTAADTMSVYNFSTSRFLVNVDMASYPNILAYLKRVGERPAYKSAMKKCEPDLQPVLGKELPGGKTLIEQVHGS